MSLLDHNRPPADHQTIAAEAAKLHDNLSPQQQWAAAHQDHKVAATVSKADAIAVRQPQDNSLHLRPQDQLAMHKIINKPAGDARANQPAGDSLAKHAVHGGDRALASLLGSDTAFKDPNRLVLLRLIPRASTCPAQKFVTLIKILDIYCSRLWLMSPKSKMLPKKASESQVVEKQKVVA